MLRNNLRISFRMLARKKFYSAINIVGLSCGFGIVMLISLYVRFELSFENENPLADRLVRITMDYLNGETVVDQDAETYHPMGPRMLSEFSEIESFARAYPVTNTTIKVGDKFLSEHGIFAVDTSFLHLFNCSLLSGNRHEVLTKPYEALLTKSLALKYFGKTDVVGESIWISRFDRVFRIAGLVADPPPNTHLKFNMLLSYTSLRSAFGENGYAWDNNNAYTYLLLSDVKHYSNFLNNVRSFNDRLHAEGKILNEQVIAQPVKDIHLYSHKSFELEQNGDADAVFFLLGVAILVIVIAVVNYINLSTASSLDRAKEVGIRKVIGSTLNQLRARFFTESFLINIISGFIALTLVIVLLPGFRHLAGLPPDFHSWGDLVFYSTIISVILVSTILSSVFPAFILSGFQPITTLKGKLTRSKGGVLLRKVLVTFQFSITIFLLIQTFTADRQLTYMREKELGLDSEQTIVVRSAANMASENYQLLKDKLLMHSQFQSVALSSCVPGQPTSEMGSTNVGVTVVGATKEQSYNFYMSWIDADYLPTMKMNLIAGKNFLASNTSEENILVNEEALRLWDISNAQAAIGQRINLWGSQRTIVGVIGNFHQSSPKSPYLPMIFLHSEGRNKLASIRVAKGNLQENLNVIRDIYATVFPDSPFEYFFLDQEFDKQYRSEEQFQQVFGTLTVFAILISCLGLFGLVSFNLANRTKEIGIRKVLGANGAQIVTLISKDFVALVLLAMTISTSITFFLIRAWLERYAFKIDLNPWLFIGPAMIVFLVSLLTIVTRTVSISLVNPVNSLKED
ncbi:MAG TPA: FtsX-like permease family protein [Chryseolinea sp.]|nr:FtsX-like permease family protein [Chryseolinea sp.]